MTFEQHILNEVSRAEPEVKAYFFNGTLFYKSTESQSRRIFSNLMRLQAGRVAIHMVDQEYAIDFTAEKPLRIADNDDFDFVYYGC